jgi:hypothetical protein
VLSQKHSFQKCNSILVLLQLFSGYAQNIVRMGAIL